MDKVTLLKMQTAFCNVFKCRKEACENTEIQKWMEDAPLELVDYEGTLDGETPKLRDMRKERFEVYDGDIKPLAECLKEIKPEYKPLTMWEVVFTAYNEILNVDTIIHEAEHQLRDSSQSLVGASDAEALKTSSSVSTEAVPNEEIESSPIESVDEEQPTGNHEESIEHSLFNKSSNSDTEELPVATKSAESGTRDVGIAKDEEHININQSLKEDKQMSNLNEMKKLAGQGQNPGGTIVSKPSINADAIESTRTALANDIEARTAWTKNNLVEKVICATQPAALRYPANPVGVVKVEEGDARTKAVNKLYDNFKAATGYDPMSIKEGETQSLKEKFPKVPADSEIDLRKAEAVLNMINQLKANKDMELPVYVPEKVNYPISGCVIGGEKYNMNEFQNLLVAKSSGAAYAMGALDAQGGVIAEGTVFIFSTIEKEQKKKDNAQGQTPTSNPKATGVSVVKGQIRVKNKNTFVGNTNNIITVFPTVQGEDKEQMKYVSAAAAMEFDGEIVPASFRYLKEEKSAENGTNEVKTVKKTFSLRVRTLIKLTEQAPIAEFEGIAEKFGKAVGLSTAKAKEAVNYTDPEAVKAMLEGTSKKDGTKVEGALVKMLAAMASGAADQKAEGEVADLVNAIKDKASATTEKANQDAQAEMDSDTI